MQAAGAFFIVETSPNMLAGSSAPPATARGGRTRGAGGPSRFHASAGGGLRPAASFRVLELRVWHFHLKNIASAVQLDAFRPPNVFAASVRRERGVGWPSRRGVGCCAVLGRRNLLRRAHAVGSSRYLALAGWVRSRSVPWVGRRNLLRRARCRWTQQAFGPLLEGGGPNPFRGLAEETY